MNAKSLALAALRVLAIYLIIEGISAIPFLSSSGSYADVYASTFVSAIGISTVLLPLVLGIILWFVSPFIANQIAGKGNGVFDSEPMTGSSVQVIAFVTLGVYLITVTIPGLIGEICRWALGINQPGVHSSIYIEFLIADISRILLGFALIMGARFFTTLFKRLREFGLPPAQD